MKPFRYGNIVLRTAILALLLPVGLLAAQNPDSKAISNLLDQVKSHAALASSDAAMLTGYTRSAVAPESHGEQLNLIKKHVNNLLRDASAMKDMRHEGSPWQQEAIDRIEPLLPLMAAHLTATITHFNENRKAVRMKPYRDYVAANERMLADASKLISTFADYSEAKFKADELEKNLELKASNEPGL